LTARPGSHVVGRKARSAKVTLRVDQLKHNAIVRLRRRTAQKGLAGRKTNTPWPSSKDVGSYLAQALPWYR